MTLKIIHRTFLNVSTKVNTNKRHPQSSVLSERAIIIVQMNFRLRNIIIIKRKKMFE